MNEPTDDAALIAGQFSCPHDLSERETACADGYCPLCDAPVKAALRREIAQLTRELDGTREARTWQRLRAEQAEQQLRQAHDVQNGMLRDLQAALADQPPREPTTEMMLAGLDVQDANDGEDTAGVWRAMYDAAPKP